MDNYRIIYKIIGHLLLIEMLFMLICGGMAFAYREDDVMAFALSAAITAVVSLICKYFGRLSGNNLSRRDAYLVVTAVWVVFSLFGMLPFLIGGYIPNVTDAYFETMSGFTTTGATILDDVECLPHGILFWRSLMQWIGGLGIVFFTIAVLPSMVGGSTKVFAAEVAGPFKSKMHPRLTTSAKWLWSIYLALTCACFLAYWLAGMGWFDGLNYAMTTTATGGFAPHNDSAKYFISPAIEYISLGFQFLAGMNFILLYAMVFKGQVLNLFRNSEFRVYLSIVLASTAFIMYMLITHNGYGLEKAFRCAWFPVASSFTTTGLFNDDA